MDFVLEKGNTKEIEVHRLISGKNQGRKVFFFLKFQTRPEVFVGSAMPIQCCSISKTCLKHSHLKYYGGRRMWP